MPYVERVTRAGKTIEVERYFTSRYKKPGIKRGDKVKPTKEEQKKVNTSSREKITITVKCQFWVWRLSLRTGLHTEKGTAG